MAGGLTSHDYSLEPGLPRLRSGPGQRRAQLPRARVAQPATGQHRAVMISHDQLLDLISQVDPPDRPITRDHLAQTLPPVVVPNIAAGQFCTFTIGHPPGGWDSLDLPRL